MNRQPGRPISVKTREGIFGRWVAVLAFCACFVSGQQLHAAIAPQFLYPMDDSDLSQSVARQGGEWSNLTNEQKVALRQAGHIYVTEANAEGSKWIGRPNSYLPQAQAAHNRIVEKFRAEIRAILAWPNGKDPNAKTEAEKAAENIENTPKIPENPYDDDKRLEKLNLTPEQKAKIEKLRKERQKAMAAIVKAAAKKKNTVKNRRTFVASLRFFFALYNYRMRYTFTPRQIDIFNEPPGGGPSGGPGIEPPPIVLPPINNLTGGTKPDDLLKGGEEESGTEAKKRLTRTNFYDFPEFQSFLGLDDTQMTELAGYDAVSRAAIQAAQDADVYFAFQDCDKELGKIQNSIRRLIPREQRESFNALSLLLFDAMEFPSQNIASFSHGEGWTGADEIKVQEVLMPFFYANKELVLDPAEVPVSELVTLQQTLEKNVRSALPAGPRAAWKDAKTSNPVIYEAVKKYKNLDGMTDLADDSAAAQWISDNVPENMSELAKTAVESPYFWPGLTGFLVLCFFMYDRIRWRAVSKEMQAAKDAEAQSHLPKRSWGD